MKLLVDIGNTNTAIAVAKGKKLQKRYFIHTSKKDISARALKRLLRGDLDKIDSITPLARQRYMLSLVIEICDTEFDFENFEKIPPFFKQVINILKQMNYSEFQQDNFNKYEKELRNMIEERRKK